MKSLVSLLLAGAAFGPSLVWAAPEPVQDWTFTATESLPRRAAAHPVAPQVPAPRVTALRQGPVFFDLMPTAGPQSLTLNQSLSGPFSVDMWLLDHVNQPVGALMSAEGGGWVLGYRSGQVVFGPLDETGKPLLAVAGIKEGYKERWHHLVGVYDGIQWRLYINGEPVASAPGRKPVATQALTLTGYFEHEPYMALADLVQGAAVHGRALSAAEVKTAFAARAQLVDEGRLYADRLHFTQPPYLNTPAADSIEISWETDRAASFTLEWGETADSLQSVAVSGQARLGGWSLSGLKADTPYFYRVTAIADDGKRIDSGLLSFRTAPLAGAPFTIAIAADTEARPHINRRMSELIWEERPNLLLMAGDLTDGGSQEKRFEWTHEYFAGMGPLFGRVPVIAAPGNGESELHWFRHYHRQPGEENYFSHIYGDVEIFVLDSDYKYRDTLEPGFSARQKQWLEAALKASTAKWKFVMHHYDVMTTDDDDHGNSWTGRSSFGNDDLKADYVPLYERYGVDLVIYGHLHAYERSWPQNGVTYLQVGGMGGNLEDFAPNKPAFNRKTARAHHFVMARGAGDDIQFEMIDSEGRVRDRFSLHKAEGAPPR